jgi:uncharacterized protein (TIGR00369 family)
MSQGVLWDVVSGQAPLPHAAATLGWQLVEADADHGAIVVAFDATEAFTNPRGEVLGGFLAAMLYDTVGPALLATLEKGQFIATDKLDVSFLRTAHPGRIVGRGRVVQRDGPSALVEGALESPDGAALATATAVLRVIAL